MRFAFLFSPLFNRKTSNLSLELENLQKHLLPTRTGIRAESFQPNHTLRIFPIKPNHQTIIKKKLYPRNTKIHQLEIQAVVTLHVFGLIALLISMH